MAKALILGGGMVGSMMALDLCRDEDFEVCLADRDPEVLAACTERCEGRVATALLDVSDSQALARICADQDVILGALASKLGLLALEAVISVGRPYVDISFMAEDGRALDERARKAGVCAIIDCGIAPGMSNILAAHACATFDEAQHLSICVGGLPVERRWPFQYKAGFAPSDVIEEYTREVRMVENGQLVHREALSDVEQLDFEGVGTLEAFHTDGLRSLVDTLPVPNMVEKTLRYPGHVELMRVFRATGLLSEEAIAVGGATVAPRALLSQLMFPMWSFEDGEEDLTVMRIQVTGERNGQTHEERWELHDRYHAGDRARSMSRTTALPCTLVARLLASGRFREPGVHPPERLAAEAGVVDEILRGLQQRDIHFRHRSRGVGPEQ